MARSGRNGHVIAGKFLKIAIKCADSATDGLAWGKSGGFCKEVTFDLDLERWARVNSHNKKGGKALHTGQMTCAQSVTRSVACLEMLKGSYQGRRCMKESPGSWAGKVGWGMTVNSLDAKLRYMGLRGELINQACGIYFKRKSSA